MKVLLRSIFTNLASIYLVGLFFPGFSTKNSLQTLITAAIVLTILNKLVIPIIKLLLLPINLITLGLFRWVSNVIALILLHILVNGISIHAFQFSGFEYSGFVVPSFPISLLFSYILTAILLRFFASSIRYLFSA